MDYLSELSNNSKKPCKICGKSMPLSAIKCTSCNSYQKWYHNLGVSATILALLTALVSVIGNAAPSIISALKSHDSRLTAKLQYDDEQGGVMVAVANFGDRPGGIDVAHVRLTVPAGTQKIEYTGKIDETISKATLLEPQRSILLRVIFDVKENKLDENELNENCVIKISANEFSGRKTDFLDEEPCRFFSALRKARAIPGQPAIFQPK